MIVYIAGPITGHLYYRERFNKAEAILHEMGHITINPAYLPSGLKHYMTICKAMVEQADAVFLLTGWGESVGAMEEFEYARSLEKKIFYEEDL